MRSDDTDDFSIWNASRYTHRVGQTDSQTRYIRTCMEKQWEPTKLQVAGERNEVKVIWYHDHHTHTYRQWMRENEWRHVRNSCTKCLFFDIWYEIVRRGSRTDRLSSKQSEHKLGVCSLPSKIAVTNTHWEKRGCTQSYFAFWSGMKVKDWGVMLNSSHIILQSMVHVSMVFHSSVWSLKLMRKWFFHPMMDVLRKLVCYSYRSWDETPF